MVFSKLSIRIKMMALICIAAGLVFMGGLVGILKSNDVIDEYRTLLGVEKQHQVDLIQVQSHFKSMVQNWKNLLIRGSDKKQREKYWGRFQKGSNSLTKHLKMNLETYRTLAASDPHWAGAGVVKDMEKLIPEWEAMLLNYQNGYTEFVSSGYIAQAGDKAVTGIDRGPANLIDKIAGEIDEIVSAADESVAADAATGSTTTLGVMLISLIGSIVFAAVVIQRVALRPLTRLEEDIQRLAGGDFSQEIEITTGDELGNVAKGAQSLQEQLGHIIRNITAASDRLADASTSMQATSQEAAEAVDRQKNQTEQAATAMNQMSATSHEVARNAGNGAAAAKDADEQSRQGNKVVDQTIQTINELALEMKKAVDVIQELSQNSESIGGILDVIRGIADQTNLLALNAAIEAARAGEQGRGFAVVADEVRTLAKRTQDSTEEIQTMIEQLQSGTREAVTVMDSGYKKTEICVSQAAKAGEALAAIAEAVTVISDMNDQIASAAEEQTAVAEEININVSNIAEITEQTVQLVGQTTSASEEVDVNAEKLKELVSGLKV